MNKSQIAGAEPAKNEIIAYQPDETLRLDVRLESETVWLTRSQLCDLFGVVKSNVSYHLKNIFASDELDHESTVQIIRTAQNEGVRRVFRDVEYYNLDVIISLGFPVPRRGRGGMKNGGTGKFCAAEPLNGGWF